MKITTTKYSVCEDCMQIICFGDDAQVSDAGADAPYHVDRMAAEHNGYWAEVCEDSDEFSWARCECCGSKLGGKRYTATMMGHMGEDSCIPGQEDGYNQGF